MPRDPRWLEIMNRLDAAYSTEGRAALEKMKPIEVLALHNEKVHELNNLERIAGSSARDAFQRICKENLIRAANDIAEWVNERERAEDKNLER